MLFLLQMTTLLAGRASHVAVLVPDSYLEICIQLNSATHIINELKTMVVVALLTSKCSISIA